MTANAGWIFINVLTVLLLLADLYFYKDEIAGNTWSQIIIEKCKKHYYYPFLWGCLMGHWFL